MLEIVFSDGKIGAKAVKIIGLAENSKLNSAFLSKDEQALAKKAIMQANFTGKKTVLLKFSVPAANYHCRFGRKAGCHCVADAGRYSGQKTV